MMGNNSSRLIKKINSVPIFPPKDDIEILSVMAIDEEGRVDTLGELTVEQCKELDDDTKALIRDLKEQKKEEKQESGLQTYQFK